MLKKLVLIGLLVVLSAVCLSSCATATKVWDRPALVALMDQYLAALVKHDPAAVPLACNVKFVENVKKAWIGQGLWATAAEGPKDFRIYVADPAAGEVGFFGVIREQKSPAILAARLRVVDGKITEIDHMVVHDVKEPLIAGLQKPRPGLVQPVQASEKVPREQMLKAANSYYDAIEQDDGKVAPFADDCQRHENGMTSANNKEKPPEGTKEEPIAIFGRMSCSDQLSTGVMAYITKIDQRRLFAVDEEMGLVFAYSMFNHSGEQKVLPIKGVPGITEMPNNWGAFNVPAAHVFKIRNGQIYEIEAIGIGAPYQAKNGWE